MPIKPPIVMIKRAGVKVEEALEKKVMTRRRHRRSQGQSKAIRQKRLMTTWKMNTRATRVKRAIRATKTVEPTAQSNLVLARAKKTATLSQARPSLNTTQIQTRAPATMAEGRFLRRDGQYVEQRRSRPN